MICINVGHAANVEVDVVKALAIQDMENEDVVVKYCDPEDALVNDIDPAIVDHELEDVVR